MNEIDGRIFEFTFHPLTDNEYYFSSLPGDFRFQSWAIFLGILWILFTIVFIWLLKKRRDRFYVEKFTRKVFSKHLKISLGLSIIYILLIFLRTQNVAFVSMRIWIYLLLLINLGNLVFAFLKSKNFFKKESVKPLDLEEKVGNNYAQYLPKKKKK